MVNKNVKKQTRWLLLYKSCNTITKRFMNALSVLLLSFCFLQKQNLTYTKKTSDYANPNPCAFSNAINSRFSSASALSYSGSRRMP